MKLENSIVGVIGAGAMGSGIAQVAAQAGHQVILIDQNEEALVRSQTALAKVCSRLVEKGRWTNEQSAAVQGRIQRTGDWSLLQPCELIIEAIVENLEVKVEVFQNVERIVHDEAIIASNTSSLSLTAIAGKLTRPGRFLGLHFFNPAPLMALVEVIPALQTDPMHIESALALMKQWGKEPVVARDTPGFIVNRVARPFYGEALRIAEEGLANFASIDAAMRSAGFRMGPFELMDLIGNDVNYAVTCSVFEAFYYDPRYRPSLIQKQHVDAGWLGRKSGRGYYEYSEGAQQKEASQAENQWIIDRILAMLINEAADALYLGIAQAHDLETAMTKGVNYPKGLLAWANEIGIDEVLARLDQLHRRYGEDRYRASVLLREMAASGTKFSN